MKKLISVLLILCFLSACSTQKRTEFKEYENVDKDIRTIELMSASVDMTAYQGFTDQNHVFLRTTMKESFRLLDEKASGILYFGYSTCPYCLKVVPILNELAKKYNQKVYYIDVFSDQDPISDDDIQRYLSDYCDFLEKEDGEPVFFVPQVFVIVNGKIVDGHTGAVDSYEPDLQTELSKEQREELTYILESMIRVLEPES